MKFEDQLKLEQQVKEAPGYATFSVFNMNLLLVATARGTGVVIDNKTNQEIYIDILSIGGTTGVKPPWKYSSSQKPESQLRLPFSGGGDFSRDDDLNE